jgi:hypothetical protein
VEVRAVLVMEKVISPPRPESDSMEARMDQKAVAAGF